MPLTLTQQAPAAVTHSAQLLTIGALAAACHTTVRTLRYYEELDLIAPTARSQGRYRLYHPSSAKRVAAILALQNLSYSLEDIAAIVGPASTTQQPQSRQNQVEGTRQALLRQQACLEDKLNSLHTLQQALANKLEVLSTVCQPCQAANPSTPCCPACEHQSIHWS
jgi:DNA-binding transcriptional MerR regulator